MPGVMAWGLLWYDTEGTLEERAERGIKQYRLKYGLAPNACFVNGQESVGDDLVVAGCRVILNPAILKNHFWIGVTE